MTALPPSASHSLVVVHREVEVAVAVVVLLRLAEQVRCGWQLPRQPLLASSPGGNLLVAPRRAETARQIPPQTLVDQLEAHRLTRTLRPRDMRSITVVAGGWVQRARRGWGAGLGVVVVVVR